MRDLSAATGFGKMAVSSKTVKQHSIQAKTAACIHCACMSHRLFKCTTVLLCLQQVIERIDRFLDSTGAHSQVILVPSIRDIHHHAVFPQPPLALDRLGSRHPQAYTCLPNPATFSCNEVTVGVVTSDVLKHLSGQEVQKGPSGDRLPSLAGHLLGQQR